MAMSLKTPEKIRSLQRKLYCKAKAEPAFRFYVLVVAKHASGMTTRFVATIFCCTPTGWPAPMRVHRAWTA